jgi:predicted permease
MLADFALAFRGLRRRPGFAAAAITTLALGIGASTAIFSVAYGIAFRALPYPEADQLIRIYEAKPAEAQLEHDVSPAAFHAWREGAPSIDSAALFGKPRTRMLAGSDSDAVSVMSVSPAFFDVLGVRPLIGSAFRPEREYTRFTADDEAVISFDAWRRLFGRRPDVIGQTITLGGVGDDDVYRIIGVMPEGFRFAEPADMWQPTAVVELPVKPGWLNWRYEQAVARLRHGASIDGARAELETVAARLAREFPAQSRGWTVTVTSLQEAIVGRFGRAAWLLLAAVGVVFLVTCLNVGALLLARSVSRERETAVRAALGAGSWRIYRLWLAEAAVLTGCGSALGLLLAWWVVMALKAAGPPGIPRLDAVALDVPALVMAASSTLLAVIFFTVAPGRAQRAGLAERLRARSYGFGESTSRHMIRNALTIAQCGGAATLLVLALVLTRSFVKLTAVDLGWNPARVVSMTVSPPMPRELRRPWYRYVEWSDRLVATLEGTPGIERAAITTQIPLSAQTYPAAIARGRGKEARDNLRWSGVQHSVTDGYFETMGIRLLSGRTFGRDDRFSEAQHVGSAPRERGVAVVSESAARMLWPDRSAVGEALWLPTIDTVPWREVVGVVEDMQFYSVGETPIAHVFVPWTQYPTGRPLLVVRFGAHGASIPAVRDVIQAVHSGTYVEQVASLDFLVSRATAQPRFTTRLVASFALLALALAAVGIYGTLSYLVGSRTREIGIRLALGASRRAILTNIIRDGVIPAIAGGVAGLAVAVALVRTFRALLFGIEPVDPGSFAGGALALLLIAVGAALGPALRASRVDPAAALRAE